MCLATVATVIRFVLALLRRLPRWWLRTIVDAHRVFRNVHFLVGCRPFVLGIVVVELLGFAADRMVSNICMLVHKTNEICQGWQMLAFCFQVTGKCSKHVLNGFGSRSVILPILPWLTCDRQFMDVRVARALVALSAYFHRLILSLADMNGPFTRLLMTELTIIHGRPYLCSRIYSA